jgi:hypothetical protein
VTVSAKPATRDRVLEAGNSNRPDVFQFGQIAVVATHCKGEKEFELVPTRGSKPFLDLRISSQKQGFNLVVDSGYTDLLRPPLTQSWVIPGTVSASRNRAVLELNEPGAACIGLAFPTDIPKRPKAKIFDYVVIMGYPAGSYFYTPAPNVERTIRKFSSGLDAAVSLMVSAQKMFPQRTAAPSTTRNQPQCTNTSCVGIESEQTGQPKPVFPPSDRWQKRRAVLTSLFTNLWFVMVPVLACKS